MSGRAAATASTALSISSLNPCRAARALSLSMPLKAAPYPGSLFTPVKAGIKEAMETGVLAGYPVVDIKATLYDGSYHEVDSSELAFKMAGSIALRDGVKKASLSSWSPS